MSGNFKVRCTHGVLSGTYFTTGRTYEVVDRKIVLDNGENSGHEINCFEDLDKYFASQFELIPTHTGEYISVKRRKNRVVAVMSVDGEYQKSANVKLKDFDGDFVKAAKAAVDKLVSLDGKGVEKAVKADGNFKTKCIDTGGDDGLTEGPRFLGRGGSYQSG
jgi:hypothetical protein